MIVRVVLSPEAKRITIDERSVPFIKMVILQLLEFIKQFLFFCVPRLMTGVMVGMRASRDRANLGTDLLTAGSKGEVVSVFPLV